MKLVEELRAMADELQEREHAIEKLEVLKEELKVKLVNIIRHRTVRVDGLKYNRSFLEDFCGFTVSEAECFSTDKPIFKIRW